MTINEEFAAWVEDMPTQEAADQVERLWKKVNKESALKSTEAYHEGWMAGYKEVVR